MIIKDDQIAKTIERLSGPAATEWARLERFELYYRGIHEKPYMPQTATAEFKTLVSRSVTNLTRLVVHSVTQRLVVDGYKSSAAATDNAAPWEWWQANGMDSRQKSLYDTVGVHGYAYLMVMPGQPTPVMRPVSPQEWYVDFEAPDDDWGQVALKKDRDGKHWWLMDDHQNRKVKLDGISAVVIETRVHRLSHVPLVPFRNELTLIGRPTGEVESVIPVQDRLNQTVFDLLVAQTYAAAPQKWIAGLSAPTDEDGKPIVDLRAFAKSVWMDPNENAKFGSLPEANLANICRAIDNVLRMYGLMSQTPPHYLLGEMVNLSAEALIAADTTMAKKVGGVQALHGESLEQGLRLAAVAAGNAEAAADISAQVWWRDTEPRSIAAAVDALGKMVLMLQVPPEAVWEQVPGITSTDLDRWRTMAARLRLRQPVPITTAAGAGSPGPAAVGNNTNEAKATTAA